jgi:hypothetical protein
VEIDPTGISLAASCADKPRLDIRSHKSSPHQSAMAVVV